MWTWTWTSRRATTIGRTERTCVKYRSGPLRQRFSPFRCGRGSEGSAGVGRLIANGQTTTSSKRHNATNPIFSCNREKEARTVLPQPQMQNSDPSSGALGPPQQFSVLVRHWSSRRGFDRGGGVALVGTRVNRHREAHEYRIRSIPVRQSPPGEAQRPRTPRSMLPPGRRRSTCFVLCVLRQRETTRELLFLSF